MPLANFFVERFNRQLEGISPPAAKVVLAYNWPGNVRELRNAIERVLDSQSTRSSAEE